MDVTPETYDVGRASRIVAETMMAGHPDHPDARPGTPAVGDGASAGAPGRTVWETAATVNDPEIPVLSIEDLGILRDARLEEDGTAVVVITPTYSGCPAMDTITSDVREALRAAGHTQVRVDTVLQPAWTTDWMTEQGRTKLREYGIAPPTGRAAVGPIAVGLSVKCPQCDSPDTREMTRFSSTACKALYQCRACLEPFDHFKVH